MKWPMLLIVGWLAIFPRITSFPDCLRAEGSGGPLANSRLPTAPPPTETIPRPSLLRQNPAAHFHLSLGRLQLDSVRYRKGSQSLLHDGESSATASQPTPPTESLNVNSVRGNPNLHYSFISSRVRITIDADAKGPWRIESHPLGSTSSLRFIVEQSPGQPIVMTSFTSDGESKVQTATWLHLREADRATFTQYLEPIVDELLWPYRFDELADEAQALCLQDTIADPLGDSTLKAWIDELRSPNRTTRLNADRNLRNVGISLLPRLSRIDPLTLDAEQRWRLIEIQTKLQPMCEDDASRLANLIRDDLNYWQLAAGRLSETELKIVDSRLKQMGGGLPALGDNDSPRVAGSVPRRR